MDGSNLGFIFMVSSFFLVVILGLSLLLIKQSRRLKELQKPKYGFLGKPLYSFVAVVAIFSTFTYAYIYSPADGGNQFVTYYIPASEIDFEIAVEEVPAPDTSVGYKFNVLPIVDDIAWGGPNIIFDVLWEIKRDGSVFYEHLETDLNDRSPGGITYTFPEGEYTGKATVSYQGEVVTLNFVFTN